MIYNINNVTQSCYTGMKEMSNGLIGYFKLQYPSNVIDNVVYNFGNIFDAFRDTILFFVSSDRGEYNVPFEAGMGAGEAIWNIMKPPTKSKDGFPFK